VHRHGDVRLLHPRPEGVELGECDRAGPAQAIRRCRAHEDDPGAAFEHPLELGDTSSRMGRVMTGVAKMRFW
jgi:hypothetical protein